ncbi:MAG TPA: family 43 glycosylhydrolase, partial [Roseiflexaceae bacterium]|nr:family 43 glycosylhydrolase [Roseiflexaceae bacterium]
FKSPDGREDWIIYHANRLPTEGCTGTRITRAQPFTWNSDGTPNFGTPVALGTPIPAPSGEKP